MYVEIVHTRPNVVLIFIICTSLILDSPKGAYVGIVLGACFDLIAGRYFGVHTILGLLTGTFIGMLNTNIYRENLTIASFFTFVFSMLYELLYYLIIFVYRGYHQIGFIFTNIILPEAIYNLFMLFVLWIPIRWLIQKFYSEDRTNIRL